MEQKSTGKNFDRMLFSDYKTADLDIEISNISEMSDDEKIDFVAERILKKYHGAFEALAK